MGGLSGCEVRIKVDVLTLHPILPQRAIADVLRETPAGAAKVLLAHDIVRLTSIERVGEGEENGGGGDSPTTRWTCV